MKMNKIIIPAAALAMGVALVGSVSSTLAWYQYSTKAQAAYVGTSVGQSENLEIKKSDGTWASNLLASDIDDLINAQATEANPGTNMSPITPAINGNLAANAALPANFFNSVETGVAGYDTYGDRYADHKNYIEFTLNIRYRKTNYAIDTSAPNADPNGYLNKNLKLIDLTILDTAGNAGAEKDLYKAVRVHFSTASSKSLFSSNKDSADETIQTNTYGKLDTDNRGGLDKGWAYEWDNAEEIVYGANNSVQSAYNANAIDPTSGHLIGVLPASEEEGLAVKVTIWLEGWQKLSGIPAGNAETGSSAMWDPAVYARKNFKVGMRFQAEDIPAQNP